MRSTHKKIMKKFEVISETLDREFAFIKGNRPTNNKSVNAKMKSIEEYGLLSPITVVDGEKVIASGGHLVTLDGREIADQDSDNYLAVLDGQHRLIAYIKLGLDMDELVVTEPLNTEMSIAALIAECSLSTGTNSVSISPFAIYVETICGISVDGVIGNAGITSGLIWRIAKDTASFPDIRSFLAILSSLLHCDCIKWTGFCTNTASFTVVIIKFYSFTIF